MFCRLKLHLYLCFIINTKTNIMKTVKYEGKLWSVISTNGNKCNLKQIVLSRKSPKRLSDINISELEIIN